MKHDATPYIAITSVQNWQSALATLVLMTRVLVVERLDVLFVSATALAPVNTTREGNRAVRIQVGSGVLDLTNPVPIGFFMVCFKTI
jgi:hypothetical protein